MKVKQMYITNAEDQHGVVLLLEDGNYMCGRTYVSIGKDYALKLIQESAPPKLLVKKGTTVTIGRYSILTGCDVFSVFETFPGTVLAVNKIIKNTAGILYELQRGDYHPCWSVGMLENQYQGSKRVSNDDSDEAYDDF